jgi:tetratricopeptide (TPR) repeat protein
MLEQPPATIELFCRQLSALGALATAMSTLRKSQAQHPGDFWLNSLLAGYLYRTGPTSFHESIAFYRAALAIRPENPVTHVNLGTVFMKQGRLEEARVEMESAVRIDSTYALPRANLGGILWGLGQQKEAFAELDKAIQLDSAFALPHTNRGKALSDLGRSDDAIQEFKTAIELEDSWAVPHHNLAWELAKRPNKDEAIKEYKRAIALDANDARPHNDLGVVYRDLHELDKALTEFNKASELDSRFAKSRCNAGAVLLDMGGPLEALSKYYVAILLDPMDWLSHNGLACTMRQLGQQEEALKEFAIAAELNSKLFFAPFNRAETLLEMGRFQEAKEEYAHAHKLGFKAAAESAKRCDRLMNLESRLPTVLKGETSPANTAESLEFASLCQQSFKRLYVHSARLYSDAFVKEPQLANDIAAHHRYNAACAAALAGMGQGADAAILNEVDRAKMWNQALAWLQADFAVWDKLFSNNSNAVRAPLMQTMQQWQKDADLALVRGEAIDHLLEAERAGWRELWAKVQDLSKRAAKQP